MVVELEKRMVFRTSPPPIWHISQRGGFDCVIATVATVANMPYKEVAKLAPVALEGRGLLPREVLELLQTTTNVRWRGPTRIFFRRLRSFCKAEYTVVLFIRKPHNIARLWTRPLQHCIAVRNGRVFDPRFSDPYSIDRYPNASWVPTIAFRPSNAHQLNAIQSRNAEQFCSDQVWGEIFRSPFV